MLTETATSVEAVVCSGRGLAPPSHFQSRNCSCRSSGLVCCSGWAQLGNDCLTRMYQSTSTCRPCVCQLSHVVSSSALCEGNFTCKENEVCVRPNECRCRHGYFGASCETSKGFFWWFSVNTDDALLVYFFDCDTTWPFQEQKWVFTVCCEQIYHNTWVKVPLLTILLSVDRVPRTVLGTWLQGQM